MTRRRGSNDRIPQSGPEGAKACCHSHAPRVPVDLSTHNRALPRRGEGFPSRHPSFTAPLHMSWPKQVPSVPEGRLTCGSRLHHGLRIAEDAVAPPVATTRRPFGAGRASKCQGTHRERQIVSPQNSLSDLHR